MKDRIDNGLEVDDKNENDCATEVQTPPTFKEKIRIFFYAITVEPFLICFILGMTLSSLAVQIINTEKACRVALNYTEEVCRHVIDADNSDNITEEAESATIKVVSDMTSWQLPLQYGVSAFLILFLGVWSDKTGNRKALMLIPTVGEIVSNFGMLWASYFFMEVPLWSTALIEALPSALSGGYSVAVIGVYSFLADITTEQSRTFRFGVNSVVTALGFPLGLSISGIVLKKMGYLGVFSIILVAYIIGFIYTYLNIHNVRNDKTKGTLTQEIIDFFHPKHFWELISLILMSSRKQSIKIILVICAFIVVQGPSNGEAVVLYLYALRRYKMTAVDYTFFSTYSMLMGITGTAVAVSFFSKYLKIHDTFVGIIATTCKIVSSIVYGLAPTRGWFYAGPAFDFFGPSGLTAIRSLGTKVVTLEQVGKLFSLIGLVESLVPIIYIPLYSQLFIETVDTLPGAFYFVGGAMTVPALFIFLALFILHKKDQKDIVQNPESKEMYTYNNEFLNTNL
ncbi:hypothetical protein K1T71_010279 [Dendrolimus kikuchii]|uniref:Uncharacterized protein n=1 Tax=Dendrolimus kikuchii TaxID=765133 RepID=A0ACC1CRE3_9NEOP|nr:hypothetical protein K1T71_010279 [Dendrolimus kikuchii]